MILFFKKVWVWRTLSKGGKILSRWKTVKRHPSSSSKKIKIKHNLIPSWIQSQRKFWKGIAHWKRWISYPVKKYMILFGSSENGGKWLNLLNFFIKKKRREKERHKHNVFALFLGKLSLSRFTKHSEFEIQRLTPLCLSRSQRTDKKTIFFLSSFIDWSKQRKFEEFK